MSRRGPRFPGGAARRSRRAPEKTLLAHASPPGRKSRTTMTHRLRWLLLGIACVALFVWLAITFWLPSSERIPAVAAARTLPLPAAAESIDFADLERTLPERAVVPQEVPPAVVANQQRVLLRGSVLGPVSDLEKVQVAIFAKCRVRAEHQPPHRPALEVSVDREGRFEAEVTQLLAE